MTTRMTVETVRVLKLPRDTKPKLQAQQMYMFPLRHRDKHGSSLVNG